MAVFGMLLNIPATLLRYVEAKRTIEKKQQQKQQQLKGERFDSDAK